MSNVSTPAPRLIDTPANVSGGASLGQFACVEVSELFPVRVIPIDFK